MLNNATKEQRRPDGTYGLIKLADDLALGKFRTGGSTKKGLYLFAMVYNMTYYPGETKNSKNIRMFNYDSDIEKNLFRDYYCNNLIRFITKSYKGRNVYEVIKELQNGDITDVGSSKELLKYDNWYKIQYLKQLKGDIYE